MNKWIAVFDLEDGDAMPDHMDLQYAGSRIDFYCNPVDKLFEEIRSKVIAPTPTQSAVVDQVIDIINKYFEG